MTWKKWIWEHFFFFLGDSVITSGMLAMVAKCAAAFQTPKSP